MVEIKFNKVPSWCPYSVKQISDLFEFDLNNASGIVTYKCVHCHKSKKSNVCSLRKFIKAKTFTSLCTGCRGEIQSSKKEIFNIKKVPYWMNDWFFVNNKSVIDLTNILNSGEIVNHVQGVCDNRAIKFHCIRCSNMMISTVSRLKTAIKRNKYTGLCRQCMSSVRHKVSLDKPRIQPNGYAIIQKSLIPLEHHWLFDWSSPVMTHRYNMAVKLNRPLTSDEIVHHIDGDKSNNDLSNLELWNDSHPSGQRIEDKIKWANEIIELYKDYNKYITT